MATGTKGGWRLEGELRESLLEHIESGKTLSDWLRQPGRPKRSTVYAAINIDPELTKAFELARDLGADALAEETLTIIDTEPEFVATENGSHRDSAHVQWLKNRAWQRMQLLAKWNPKKYGEKLDLSGSLTHAHTTVDALEAARQRVTEAKKQG